jgi:hypothetical protein
MPAGIKSLIVWYWIYLGCGGLLRGAEWVSYQHNPTMGAENL